MWILAKIYDSIFGLSKLIDWIFIYCNCFVLFLEVEYNNLIEKNSISTTVIIFSSIKSWAGKGWNLYITKNLKIHKSLTNCLIIWNYTIFGKQLFWIFKICYQKKVFSYKKERKRALNAKKNEMTLKIVDIGQNLRLNFWPF